MTAPEVELAGYGRSRFLPCEVVRAAGAEEISAAYDRARREGRRVVLRGAGYAYGDAAIGRDAIVLDVSPMNRILSWDAESGELTCEPGLRVRDAIDWGISDGWFPPVVPGSAAPTLGGCVSANIHGKNALRAGTIGAHLAEVEALLPNGRSVSLAPEDDGFRALVGGMGLLGVVTRVRLRLRRVHSGLVESTSLAARSLEEALALLEAHPEAEHRVGWIDARVGGSGLGRGTLHLGRELREFEDRNPARSLRPEAQRIPTLPVGPLVRAGLALPRLVNLGKYLVDRIGAGRPRLLPHAAFHFLLDRIPGWNLAYPHGFVQFQPFVPTEGAAGLLREILETLLAKQIAPTLAVLKRHRPDEFLLSPSLDGWSLALDLPLPRARESGGLEVLREKLAPIQSRVAAAGGRFYLAKDATLTPEPLLRSLGPRLAAFRAARVKFDPEGILTSALAERVGLA